MNKPSPATVRAFHAIRHAAATTTNGKVYSNLLTLAFYLHNGETSPGRVEVYALKVHAHIDSEAYRDMMAALDAASHDLHNVAVSA